MTAQEARRGQPFLIQGLSGPAKKRLETPGLNRGFVNTSTGPSTAPGK